MTSERHAPNVLYLEGDVTAAAVAALGVRIEELLAGEALEIVLELSQVTAVAPALAPMLEALVADVGAVRRSIILQLPEGHLDALADTPLAAGVRVERTRHLRLVGGSGSSIATDRVAVLPVARVRSPDEPRREGPGFIVSYGEGRHCEFPGCSTTLSRYNGRDLCALHAPPQR
jgi:ABC-type transporter Mla MlaB component